MSRALLIGYGQCTSTKRFFFCACNGPRKRKETQAERELREVPWLCLSRKLVIPMLSGGGEGGGEEFLNFAAYLACVAWRFKQSERAAANTSGEAARRNLGERLSQTPRGFAASFRSFAAFSARSDCLNRRATQATVYLGDGGVCPFQRAVGRGVHKLIIK